ncbi:arsenate reductase/protein-tyrosine-phosphatase family protein [Arthrobacter humicola]
MKKILLVCTANICRSPYAVAVLGARLSLMPGQPGIQVISAGTRAATSAGLCEEAASDLSNEPELGDSPVHASSFGRG